MGPEFQDLTGFQRDLLTATRLVELNEKRPIGLSIRDTLESNGYEPIPGGRLYPVLDELVAAGLLTKEPDPDDERANRYSVTDAGLEILVDQYEFLNQAVATEVSEVIGA